MGVPIGEASGDHPALLECVECGERFETDETLANDCPHCGAHNHAGRAEIVDGGDPDGWR